MKIQLALDAADLEKDIRIAGEVAKHVDVIECGTGVLLKYGLAAVTKLKETFPDKLIVCDQKIMDGGYGFGVMAADAGADIFTVLGVAFDDTIKRGIKAAGEKNVKIMIDMCSVENYIERAKQVVEWGADYVCVHTPNDLGADLSYHARIAEVAEAIGKERCAVAGSLNVERCKMLKAVEPEIVIVGSFITKAESPREAVLKIRKALYE